VREPPIILVRRAGALNSRRAAAKDSGPSASWLETASLIAAMLAFMPGAFEPDDRTGGLGERRDDRRLRALPGNLRFHFKAIRVRRRDSKDRQLGTSGHHCAINSPADLNVSGCQSSTTKTVGATLGIEESPRLVPNCVR
jgi:hypothetical protein